MLHARDQYHPTAARTWHEVRAARREVITTNLVMAESHALLARRAGVKVGLRFWDSFVAPVGPRMIWADAELTQDAVERWLRRYHDAVFSLTDAVSFEVMRRERIAVAFSYDRDFHAAGFELLGLDQS